MIEEFRNAFLNRYREIEEIKRQGKKVIGWTCIYIPEEVIYAAGIIPVRILAGAEETPLGDSYMYANTCSMVRSCLEEAGRGNLDFLDGFVSCNSCDHIRRSYDAWTRFFKTPFTHFFTLPHKVTENSISFFKEEIIRFKNRLEEFFGVKITEESLRQAIEIYNKNRTLLKKLYQLRMADSPPISGAETLDVIMAGMVLPKERHNQMLGKLLEELASKDQGYHSEARLLIAGSELQTSDYIKIIEDLGGLVVTDDLSNGTKYFWDLVNAEGEVTEALARRYLMRNSCTRMFTVEERINQIKEMIEKFRVNGIIYQKIKFCDLMGCIYPVLKKRLTDLGIPILALEKEYGLAGAGQLRTRAQAFLEMIYANQ